MLAADDQEPQPKFVSAVMQAISVLRVLARTGEPAGAAAVARDAGISVSTCFNILRTLANQRLVSFDPAHKTYQIGLGMLEFSAPLLGASQADLIRPEMVRLSEGRRCVVCLWSVTENERIVLVDRIAGSNIVRIDVALGSRLPAFVGAVGRCYAATRALPSATLRKSFDRLQWQAAPAFEDYASDVQRAATDGFALDLGNLFAGVEIAAAMVTDASGAARFGISVIAIAGQMSRDELGAAAHDLRDTADWISETLFGVAHGERQADRKRRAARQEAALAGPSRGKTRLATGVLPGSGNEDV